MRIGANLHHLAARARWAEILLGMAPPEYRYRSPAMGAAERPDEPIAAGLSTVHDV